MSAIRTLLVDGSRTFRAAAEAFLINYPRIDLVGQANSGYAALQMISRLRPDLVLVELAMPDMNGLEVTQKVKATEKPPVVIMLTLFEPKEYRHRANAAGADGFVAKDSFAEELMPLVSALFDGKFAAGASDRATVPTLSVPPAKSHSIQA